MKTVSGSSLRRFFLFIAKFFHALVRSSYRRKLLIFLAIAEVL
jgi:hypothetical protein